MWIGNILTFIILWLGATFVISSTPALSQTATTPEQAADEGMQAFSELVTPQTAKQLGFASVTEASLAYVDKESPLRVNTVNVSDLRKFKRGNDPKKLLNDENIVIFPIKIGQTVRSSMTVARLDDQTWDATGWGAPGLIDGLTKLKFSDTNIVVWIPELNIYFLGEYEQDGKLMLAPLGNRPEFKLEARVWKPAESLFVEFSHRLPSVKPLKSHRSPKMQAPG